MHAPRRADRLTRKGFALKPGGSAPIVEGSPPGGAYGPRLRRRNRTGANATRERQRCLRALPPQTEAAPLRIARRSNAIASKQ